MKLLRHINSKIPHFLCPQRITWKENYRPTLHGRVSMEWRGLRKKSGRERNSRPCWRADSLHGALKRSFSGGRWESEKGKWKASFSHLWRWASQLRQARVVQDFSSRISFGLTVFLCSEKTLVVWAGTLGFLRRCSSCHDHKMMQRP